MADDAEFEPELAPRPGGLGGLRRKGIYLLPNLLTTGGLFAGFYSIVASIDGNFTNAAWAGTRATSTSRAAAATAASRETGDGTTGEATKGS